MADIYKADITAEQVLDDLRGKPGVTTRAQRRRASRKTPELVPEGESDSSLTPLSGEDFRARKAADVRGGNASKDNARSKAEGREVHSSAEDTLDSDGFIVPRRVARAKKLAKATMDFSGPGTGFDSSFFEPTEDVDADNEGSDSEDTGTRPSSRMSWAEMAEDPSTDPFGPIPEEWSQIPTMGSIRDPYGDIPLDWMKPEATSTPVMDGDKSIFDELVEITVENMSPKTREIWATREARIREQGAVGSGESEATVSDDDSHSVKNSLHLAVIQHATGESDTDTPRYTAAQKGKGRAEPVASSSKNKYKATVESVTDEEDLRQAQIRFDESMARQILENDILEADRQKEKVKVSRRSERAAGPTQVTKGEPVPEPSETKMSEGLVTVRYRGSDGRKYEVDLPIDYAMRELRGQAGQAQPDRESMQGRRNTAEVKVEQSASVELERHESRPVDRSTGRYTAPPMPVRASTHVAGNTSNLVVPEHQMPLNSLLSRMYDRAMRARAGEPDPDPSSSDEFASSSESSPSLESSGDSEGTKRRKRERRRRWKAKQRKLKLELAAT